MKAYNIIFGDTEHNTVSKTPDLEDTTIEGLTIPERPADGWGGYAGPAIPWENWPRTHYSKTPMFHYLTIRVPEEYRPDSHKNFAAVSFFQGDLDDVYPEPVVYTSKTPFIEDYEKYVPHPEFIQLEDDMDGNFGFIWLTEEEFAQGHKLPLPDLRDDWENNEEEDSSAVNTWTTFSHDEVLSYVPAWLIERPDPNAGKVPNEENKYGYNSDIYDEELNSDSSKLYGYSHFGGTSFAVQGIPELTPFYLELEAYPGTDLCDSGNLQLDLHTNYFEWSSC